jgi:hypothetical protein
MPDKLIHLLLSLVLCHYVVPYQRQSYNGISWAKCLIWQPCHNKSVASRIERHKNLHFPEVLFLSLSLSLSISLSFSLSLSLFLSLSLSLFLYLSLSHSLSLSFSLSFSFPRTHIHLVETREARCARHLARSTALEKFFELSFWLVFNRVKLLAYMKCLCSRRAR